LYFKFHLCLKCLITGLPFLMFTMYYKSWRFGYEMCKIYMTSTSVNQYTSSMLLTILSADRYLAVCHPIAATNLRTPNISKVSFSQIDLYIPKYNLWLGKFKIFENIKGIPVFWVPTVKCFKRISQKLNIRLIKKLKRTFSVLTDTWRAHKNALC